MGRVELTRVFNLTGEFDVWYQDVEDLEFVRTLLDDVGEITVNKYVDCNVMEPVKEAHKVIWIASDTNTEYLEDWPEKPDYVVTDAPAAYAVSQRLFG